MIPYLEVTVSKFVRAFTHSRRILLNVGANHKKDAKHHYVGWEILRSRFQSAEEILEVNRCSLNIL